MEFLYYLDLLGTFVFAVSGVMTAVDKEFDLVGSTVIGFTTGLGGGTLRDLLIGNSPVGWMENNTYILVVFMAVPVCYLFRKTILKLRKSIFLFDTIGIGLFTILGLQKTLAVGLSPIVALLMGIVSAVFGGIIRDVLSNEVPLIFRKEIYATACLIGGLVFIVAQQYIAIQLINTAMSIVTVILIRYLSIRNNWSLVIPLKK